MIKWSNSRDNDARTCERRAFLKYRYASATATKEWRRFRAHLLKRAVDPTTWAGNVAHHVISSLIVPQAQERGGHFDVDQAIRASLDLIDKQFEFSGQRQFETCSRSQAGSAYCVLKSHLYDDGESELAKETAIDLCSRGLLNLARSHHDLLEKTSKAAQVYTEKEIRIRLDADLMVEAILDLLLFNRSRHALIVDWKLWGHGGFAGDQLLVYAYAVLKCGWWPDLVLDRISVLEANLLTGEKATIQPTAEDLAMVDDRIFTGAERLERIFQNPDVADVDERLFAPASRPGACLKCQVAEVCSDARFRLQQPTNRSFEFVLS